MEDDVGSSIGDLLDEGVHKRRHTGVNPNANSKQQVPVTSISKHSVERQVSVLSSADDVYVPQFSGTFNMKHYHEPQQQQPPSQAKNDLLMSITNIPLTKQQQQQPSSTLNNNNNNLNQPSSYLTQLQEIKNNYETLLNTKRKLHEEQLQLVRDANAKEISNLKEIHHQKETFLYNDISRVKNEISDRARNEKEQLHAQHQRELESLKQLFNEELKQKDAEHERELALLAVQGKEQQDYNVLAVQMDDARKRLSELTVLIEKNKATNVSNAQSQIEKRKHELYEYEMKLQQRENALITESELLAQQSNDLAEQARKRHLEETNAKTKLQSETLRLQQLQNDLKNFECAQQELHDNAELKVLNKENALQEEVNQMLHEKATLSKELESKFKVLGEDKRCFEKYKESVFKNIDTQKQTVKQRKMELNVLEREFEEKKRALLEHESMINKHICVLKEQSAYLTARKSEIEEQLNELDKMRTRIDNDIRLLTEREAKVQREHAYVEQLKNKYAVEKMNINNEKQRIQFDQKDTQLRIDAVDQLRLKLIANGGHGKNAYLKRKEVNVNENENNGNVNYKNETLTQHEEKVGMEDKALLNAEEYFKNTMKRLESKRNEDVYYNTNNHNHSSNGNNGFKSFLMKEMTYVRQSGDDLESKLKSTYDFINKNSSCALSGGGNLNK